MKLKNQLIKTVVAALKPKTLNQPDERRFLILSTTGLGDTLWGTPAIRALRQCFPDSYIGVVTSSIGQALLKYNPRINELSIWPLTMIHKYAMSDLANNVTKKSCLF